MDAQVEVRLQLTVSERLPVRESQAMASCPASLILAGQMYRTVETMLFFLRKVETQSRGTSEEDDCTVTLASLCAGRKPLRRPPTATLNRSLGHPVDSCRP